MKKTFTYLMNKLCSLVISLYSKILIYQIRYEGKIFRNIKDSLSYEIRDIYNKNVIGVDSNVDRIINDLSNVMLDIAKIPHNAPLSEKNEIKTLKKLLEKDEHIIEILFLNMQLNALKHYYQSFNIFDKESKRQANKQKFNNFIEHCTQNKLPLLFNPNKPNYKNIKKTAENLLKLNKMRVMVKNINLDKSGLLFVFNNLGNIISLSILIIIICSAVYELGYFFKIGISLSSLPIGYTDMILIALRWAPKILVALTIIILWELFNHRINNDYGKHPIVKTEEKWFKYFYLFLIASILFTPKLDNSLYFFLVLILSIIWVKFVTWMFFHPKIIVEKPYFFKNLAAYLPLIVLVFFINGFSQATIETTSSYNKYTLTLNDGEKLTNVHVLRNFSAGLLCYDLNKQIYFLPLPEIKKILLRSK